MLPIYSSESFTKYFLVSGDTLYLSLVLSRKPDIIKDQTTWDEGKIGVFEREALTLKTTVSFMRCIYLPCDKGY